MQPTYQYLDTAVRHLPSVLRNNASWMDIYDAYWAWLIEENSRREKALDYITPAPYYDAESAVLKRL